MIPGEVRVRYPRGVKVEELNEQERAWVQENEALWRRAYALVEQHPQLDVSLVYHTLVNVQRTPEARLARGLTRGIRTPHRG
jgi:hypothetical protein